MATFVEGIVDHCSHKSIRDSIFESQDCVLFMLSQPGHYLCFVIIYLYFRVCHPVSAIRECGQCGQFVHNMC